MVEVDLTSDNRRKVIKNPLKTKNRLTAFCASWEVWAALIRIGSPTSLL